MTDTDQAPEAPFRELLDFGQGSDDYFARLVALNLAPSIKVMPRTAEAFIWSGSAWLPDETLAGKAMIREELATFAERLLDDASSLDADGERERAKTFRQWAWSLLGAGRQARITGLVLADPRLTVEASRFDADPYLLATPSGTVDLRTGEVRSPDPLDFITRLTRVPYEAEAQAPRFAQFLDEITDGDEDLARYLQKVIGMSMIGTIDAQAFFIFEGDGSNGKDTLLDIVAGAVGAYMGRGNEDMLIAKKHREHSTEVYGLRGRRLVVHSESDRGRRLDIGRVKEWTGTREITARPMRQDFVTFPNTMTHVLMTNHLPVLQGTDYGTARRILVVPFPVTFYKPEDAPDGAPVRIEGLAEEITQSEGSGVLNWIVEGALRYQEEGLIPPAIVQEATATYLSEQADPYGLFAWIETRIVEESSTFTPFEMLMDDYGAWLKSPAGEGFEAASSTTVGARLSKRGYVSDRRRIDGEVVRGRRGIRLAPIDGVARVDGARIEAMKKGT